MSFRYMLVVLVVLVIATLAATCSEYHIQSYFANRPYKSIVRDDAALAWRASPLTQNDEGSKTMETKSHIQEPSKVIRRPIPDRHYLMECFSYDPTSGILKWRQRPRLHFISNNSFAVWNAKHAGVVAGTVCDGYRTVGIRGGILSAHRIIWKIVTGEEPEFIDHRDTDGTNNAWLNLRECEHRQNICNSSKPITNSSGRKGVAINKRDGRIYAYITHYGKRKHLGTFRSIELAHKAYCEAAERLYGEFWNPG